MKNKNAPSHSPIFVPDTNILYELLKGQAGFQPGKKGKESICQKINKLFDTQKVVIPSSVMMEMMGQFFHQDIPIDSLREYSTWYKMRKICFDQLIMNKVVDSSLQVDINLNPPSPHEIVNLVYNNIPDNFIDIIKKHYDDTLLHRQKYFPNKDYTELTQYYFPREPKLLDGSDAAILVELKSIAMENYPQHTFFVTNDRILHVAVGMFKENEEKLDHLMTVDLRELARVIK